MMKSTAVTLESRSDRGDIVFFGDSDDVWGFM
jgi:hypothetical protein